MFLAKDGFMDSAARIELGRSELIHPALYEHFRLLVVA